MTASHKTFLTCHARNARVVAVLLCFYFAMTPTSFAGSFNYIAHRAHSCGTGENTLAAIADTSAKGAQFIEIDVRVSTDGIAYLYHDREAHEVNLDRLTYSKVRKLVGAERSPSLHDSLEGLPATTRVILDLKNYGIVQNQAVIETLLNTGIAAHRVILQSENAHLLAAMRSSYPNAKYFLLSRLKRKPLFFLKPSASAILGLTNTFHLDGVSLKSRYFIDRDYVETLKSGGAEVFVWTINDRARADYYRQAGVDGLITDYPILLANADEAHLPSATQCNEPRP